MPTAQAVGSVSKSRLIPAAILAILVYGMIAAMLGTLLPELSKKFGLTPEQNSRLALVQALGLSLASISAGPLIDNKGKKTGLVLGLGIIAASLFALPASTGYEMIMACWFTLGFGGGIIVTAANALVSDISEEKRSSTLNLLNLFFGLGLMATPFIAGNFLAGDAIKLCYFVAVLTTATFLLHATTPMPPPSGERGFKAAEIGQLLGRPALYLLAMLLFLYVACEVGFSTWLARHLMAQGMTEKDALNTLTGFALGILIGRVVVSRILIKVPAPVVTLAAAVLMTLFTYLTLQTNDPTVALVIVSLAGVAMAPVFPTTLGMVGDAFPKATATAMGIVITSGWAGLVVSAPIIGAIAGDDPKRLQTALLVFPAASALMVLVNLAMRPMLRKAQ
ncbi:MAG: MFS transporter [Acidobacteria bacterium]|nr:MFS transporter [Acidobacteriota bacterium]